MFRKSAVEAQGALNGRVRIAPPPSWTVTNMFLLCVVVGAMIYISTANYARTVEITGMIDSKQGTPEITAPIAGYITVVSAEGSPVGENDSIVVIEPRIAGAQGNLAADRNEQNLAQIEAVEQRSQAAVRSTRAAVNVANTQAAAGRATLISLEGQLQQARNQTRLARSDFQRALGIADRGFVSKSDLEERERVIAARIEREGEIQARIAQTRGDIAGAQARAIEASSAADVTNADAQVEIAAVRQIGRTADNAERIVVQSPIAGTIGSLPVRDGQRIAQGETIALITRPNDRIIARLQVPASSLTEVDVGQEVKVSVDAYPYQRYGTLTGRIESVSSAARQTESGPVFDVEVSIAQTFGIENRQLDLLAGMTVRARIQTQKKTILEWILEPLIAIESR